MAVFLEYLGNLVGTDAVANREADGHRLRIARGAGRILNVCLL